MSNLNLIVMGASAGGVEALRSVVGGLPKGLNAAVVIVLHIPPNRTSFLPNILSRTSLLPVRHPEDGEAVVSGRVYVAPPDEHVIIEEGRLRLVHGPRESGHRPAVD